MGLKKVLIPEQNLKDVLLEDKYIGKIEVVPVKTLERRSHALSRGCQEEAFSRSWRYWSAARRPTAPAPIPGVDRPAAH